MSHGKAARLLLFPFYHLWYSLPRKSSYFSNFYLSPMVTWLHWLCRWVWVAKMMCLGASPVKIVRATASSGFRYRSSRVFGPLTAHHTVIARSTAGAPAWNARGLVRRWGPPSELSAKTDGLLLDWAYHSNKLPHVLGSSGQCEEHKSCHEDPLSIVPSFLASHARWLSHFGDVVLGLHDTSAASSDVAARYCSQDPEFSPWKRVADAKKHMLKSAPGALLRIGFVSSYPGWYSLSYWFDCMSLAIQTPNASSFVDSHSLAP